MKEIVGCKKVHNYNKDILKTIDGNKYDCIIAVDMVTQMITPLYDEAESKYLFETLCCKRTFMCI